MTATTKEQWWHEQDDESRRGFTRAIWISALGHCALILALALAPEPRPVPMPRVIMANLVAMAPVPAAKSTGGAAAPKAVPKPVPVRPAPKAVPKPKKAVLPKQPAAVSKKRQRVDRRSEAKEASYEDALAALRSDLGETLSEDAPASEAAPAAIEGPAAAASPGAGTRMDPEVAAWIAATQRHLRQVWVTPPEFLNRRLVTDLRVELSAGGDVIGTPEIVRSSGDPFWDDNTLRALRRASPLPAPPEAGTWPFTFSPE